MSDKQNPEEPQWRAEEFKDLLSIPSQLVDDLIRYHDNPAERRPSLEKALNFLLDRVSEERFTTSLVHQIAKHIAIALEYPQGGIQNYEIPEEIAQKLGRTVVVDLLNLHKEEGKEKRIERLKTAVDYFYKLTGKDERIPELLAQMIASVQKLLSQERD